MDWKVIAILLCLIGVIIEKIMLTVNTIKESRKYCEKYEELWEKEERLEHMKAELENREEILERRERALKKYERVLDEREKELEEKEKCLNGRTTENGNAAAEHYRNERTRRLLKDINRKMKSVNDERQFRFRLEEI